MNKSPFAISDCSSFFKRWTHEMNIVGVSIAIFMMTCAIGCSKSERKKVRNVLQEIAEFHTDVALLTASAIINSDHMHDHDSHREPQRIDKITIIQQDKDDRKLLIGFIEGYYADKTKPIFTFDVKINSFEVIGGDNMSIRWRISTSLNNDDAIQKCITEDRFRLRDMLSERAYYYPQGISVVVDIRHPNGTLSQLWGKIKW